MYSADDLIHRLLHLPVGAANLSLTKDPLGAANWVSCDWVDMRGVVGGIIGLIAVAVVRQIYHDRKSIEVVCQMVCCLNSCSKTR